MRKKYFLLLGLIVVSLSAFSQLSITDTASSTIANGDTVYVTGIVGYQSSDRFYINNGSKAVSSNALCVPTAVAVSGCTYSICVGSACYKTVNDNTDFQSPNFSAPAGKDTNALYTDYNPTAAGITVIRYDVRTAALSDSTWFFVKFIATPTGIANITTNNLNVSNPYPNPSNSIVNFNYHTDNATQMNIYNSLGQLVKHVSMTASKGNLSVDVSDMPSGIYICKVQSAGAETAFRRLVVSH